jgi:hypothetical protein
MWHTRNVVSLVFRRNFFRKICRTLATMPRPASLSHAGDFLAPLRSVFWSKPSLPMPVAKAVDNDLLTFANRMAGDSKRMNENTREVKKR